MLPFLSSLRKQEMLVGCKMYIINIFLTLAGLTTSIASEWMENDMEPAQHYAWGPWDDLWRLHIQVNLGEKEVETAKRYFVRVQVYKDVHVSGKINKSLNPGEDGEWIDINDQPILSERRQDQHLHSRHGQVKFLDFFKHLLSLHHWECCVNVSFQNLGQDDLDDC